MDRRTARPGGGVPRTVPCQYKLSASCPASPCRVASAAACRRRLCGSAARYLRQAIKANPADYKSYEKLALVYGYWQRWQDAHDWYLKAAELYPGSERLWFKLGQVDEQLGKPDAALTYYTKAVQIEESYQQQFRRMYPTREKVISRLGETELATARKRIEELSHKAGHE